MLTLCAKAPADPRLGRLINRARDWANERLDTAVDAVASERYADALAAVEEVLLEMRGQPESIDAARGLNAIKTLLELRHLNPNGETAKVLRRKAYEDMWGTRWARLFS